MMLQISQVVAKGFKGACGKFLLIAVLIGLGAVLLWPDGADGCRPQSSAGGTSAYSDYMTSGL